jgi:hypothetical protein
MNLAETPLARGSSRPMNQSRLKKFFAAANQQVHLAEARGRRADKRLATGFNVFDLIEPDENKLSDVLALLFNPKGGHGQGSLFLRLLFKQIGLGSDAILTRDAKVQREAPTHGILKFRRRMDVLVQARALLAIENKVDSLEQPDQVKDYLAHLHQCTRRRHIRTTLIYLTPDARPPTSLRPRALKQHLDSGRLLCWSYHHELREWLQNCRRDCAAPRIRDFLLDFMAYIKVELKRESPNNAQEEPDEN